MIDEQQIIEILSASSRLLQQKGWRKYAMARDKNGVACDLNNRNASFYCLSGALVTTWRMLDPANEDFYLKYLNKCFPRSW